MNNGCLECRWIEYDGVGADALFFCNHPSCYKEVGKERISPMRGVWRKKKRVAGMRKRNRKLDCPDFSQG